MSILISGSAYDSGSESKLEEDSVSNTLSQSNTVSKTVDDVETSSIDNSKFGLPYIIAMIKKNPNIGNSRIKHPRMLLKYLVKLETMIGNQPIKTKMAEQIVSILKQDRVNGINTNIILYGDPGAGKTTIGVYIAKILYALGCLEGNGGNEDVTQQDKKNQGSGMPGMNTNNDLNMLAQVALWVTIIFLLYVVLSGIIPPIYNLLGPKWFFISLGVVCFLGLLIWAATTSSIYGSNSDSNNCNTNSRKRQDINKNKSEENKNIEDKNIDKKKNQDNKNLDDKIIGGVNISELEDVEDDTVIKIISREDFVEQYVGWTAKNVERILRANLGKVVFIDEAYSIINSYNDPFGIEALNTLNKFIGEHKGKITVIMAGYKDKLEVLFKKQQGLSRRFMWHMSCPGYSGEELAEIFELQLKREGYSMKEPKAIKKYIADHEDYFPSYGGDTERLVNYTLNKQGVCLLSLELDTGKNQNNKVITLDNVKAGMIDLKNNNMENAKDNKKGNDELSEVDMMKFMSLLGGNKHKVSCE